jgi:hypothetical protein
MESGKVNVVVTALACDMELVPPVRVRAGERGCNLAPGLYLWFNHKSEQRSIVVKPKKTVQKAKKRGRPFEGGRDPVVGIRLSEDETAQIDALAERAGVRRSEMIRHLLEAGKKALVKR